MSMNRAQVVVTNLLTQANTYYAQKANLFILRDPHPLNV